MVGKCQLFVVDLPCMLISLTTDWFKQAQLRDQHLPNYLLHAVAAITSFRKPPPAWPRYGQPAPVVVNHLPIK